VTPRIVCANYPTPVVFLTWPAPLDAAINQLLSRDAIQVAELTREIAERAGGLLARSRMSSDNAVDAFVVATALEFDLAVIASGDAGRPGTTGSAVPPDLAAAALIASSSRRCWTPRPCNERVTFVTRALYPARAAPDAELRLPH
jgi:hypothetical protein